MEISEIELLKQQKKEIEENIAAVNNGEKVGDAAALLNELNAISNKISEFEYQAKLQEDIQTSVTTEVAKFMDTLDFGGTKPEDIFINYGEDGAKSSYNYVNAVIQNAVAKMKQAELANTNALTAEIAALQDKCNKLQQEKEELSHDLSVQNLEVSDLNARLVNATRMLDEEKAEVERLNSQVDDLRKEIAIGAAAATKVEEVDLRSAHEKWLEQRQKEEEAKTVIYDVRWKDATHKEFLANLASTDEEITIKYFEIQGDPDKLLQLKLPQSELKSGKYRVVTAELAPSFRTAAAVNAEDTTDIIPVGSEVSEEVTYTAPAFRDEDSTESAAPGLAAETSTVAGSPVTREEFEELKARVGQIESIRAVA